MEILKNTYVHILITGSIAENSGHISTKHLLLNPQCLIVVQDSLNMPRKFHVGQYQRKSERLSNHKDEKVRSDALVVSINREKVSILKVSVSIRSLLQARAPTLSILPHRIQTMGVLPEG